MRGPSPDVAAAREMWTLAGRSWWRGRALAAWVAEAECRGLPRPRPSRSRGAAAHARALGRLYSSAERKVTAPRLPISHVLERGRVLGANLEMSGAPWDSLGLLGDAGYDSSKEAHGERAPRREF